MSMFLLNFDFKVHYQSRFQSYVLIRFESSFGVSISKFLLNSDLKVPFKFRF
jgi:hypothetical protein